jgi:DNA-binding CsgD family transcriptional regulator
MKFHDPFNKCKTKHNPRKGKKWPVMPRQEMILHLYNARLKTDEVAGVMGITVDTLYKHLARIYYKLNVTNRAAAIRRGLK